MPFKKRSLQIHKKNKGKIEISLKIRLKTMDDLSLAYTPGVAAVSLAIAKNKKESYEMTNRANQIAIVSDGTAVLGLGDIGPEGAMPVMEGKSAILKEFANVDAMPLCINTKDTEEIIKFCKQIEPSFAGINLEDISAPRCFEILDRLEKELNIPVFHDDQDGTAIVVLAALINSCRIAGSVLKELSVVVSGAGAAGLAITRLLISQGVKDIILLDSKGAIYKGRKELNKYKKEIAGITNKMEYKGDLGGALVGADVFIGVSQPDLVTKKMVSEMNEKPFIFAMANPNPEILPDLAKEGGAYIVGTGRSDFSNQINNALVFPGLFRGLLDSGVKKVTQKMKISAAIALAYTVKTPTKNNILPKVTDKKAVTSIANAISKKK